MLNRSGSSRLAFPLLSNPILRVAQVVDAAPLSHDVASIYFRIKSIKGNESSLSLQTTCLVGNHFQIIKCILENEIVPCCMTFKTGVRKTVEAGSSRNFSYSQNYRLQSCVFTARWTLVFTLKLYLQKQQGFPMGRAGELPGDREELPPSALYSTGLTSLGESPPSE